MNLIELACLVRRENANIFQPRKPCYRLEGLENFRVLNLTIVHRFVSTLINISRTLWYLNIPARR